MTTPADRRAGPDDGPTGASEGERIGLVRVDAELMDRLGGAGRGQRAAAHQGDEGRRRDVRRVDLEEGPQVLARIAPSEPVRPERQVVRGQPAATMSGRAFIQSVAATIGPPSWGRSVLTYGTRAVFASGWSRFQRSAASASRRSAWNDGAL
jgi:hypothetical protein